MITDERIDHFLEHHGVKGMKWGVRRSFPSKMARAKKRKRLNDTYDQRKKDSKMSLGEKAGSLLLGGPAGLVVVKSLKVLRAREAALGGVSRPNASEKTRKELKMESHMNLGEKVVSGMLGGPLGVAAFKSGMVLVVRNR